MRDPGNDAECVYQEVDLYPQYPYNDMPKEKGGLGSGRVGLGRVGWSRVGIGSDRVR